MMKVPEITVIVPIYNAEKYLCQCLDSILAQTYKDFELLLINDGSTDGSDNICNGYALLHENVRLFYQSNSGPSIARNRGIDEARGEWITFIDADDYVTVDYLDVIHNKCVQADLTFFSNNVCYDDNSVKSMILPNSLNITEAEKNEVIRLLKQNSENYEYFGYTWNKVFRTSIIKENNIRFVEKLIIREDEVFTASYIQHVQTIATVQDIIYNYCYSSQGLTSRKKGVWQWRTYTEYLMSYMNHWNNQQLLAIDARRLLQHLLWTLEVETDLVELFHDCRFTLFKAKEYKDVIDLSFFTKKQLEFLIGNPLPFMIRKMGRCFINGIQSAFS